MRTTITTTTIATAVLGVVATALINTGPATAATGYDARARMSGHASCATSAGVGTTRKTIVLDNSRSARRAQFKVVRDGDRFADPVVYVWVPAHKKKRATVSVPQRSTVSVRVRVPEMGRHDLRLSATVPALASCYVPTVDPRASLGGVWCHGADSVAQIVLDNRATSDERARYTVRSSYGGSSAAFSVPPASSVHHYVPVPSGGSTHVEVTAGRRTVLSADVAAVSCP